MPSPGNLPNPWTELGSALKTDSLPAELPGSPGSIVRQFVFVVVQLCLSVSNIEHNREIHIYGLNFSI